MPRIVRNLLLEAPLVGDAILGNQSTLRIRSDSWSKAEADSRFLRTNDLGPLDARYFPNTPGAEGGGIFNLVQTQFTPVVIRNLLCQTPLSTRLPQAVPAPPPKLMDAPHRSTLPPKEPDQAPPTMEDLCAEKDFFDWIVAIADLQALTAKEVTGVLQPSEFATIWNTRLQALKKLPRLLLGLQTLAQNKEGRDLSWRVITSGTLEIHAEGHLTMATVDRDRKKTIHPKLTT